LELSDYAIWILGKACERDGGWGKDRLVKSLQNTPERRKELQELMEKTSDPVLLYPEGKGVNYNCFYRKGGEKDSHAP